MEEILHRAEQSEKVYDWLGAVRSYEKALSLYPQEDFLKIVEESTIFSLRLSYLSRVQE